MDASRQAISPQEPKAAGRRWVLVLAVFFGVALAAGWVGWTSWRSAELRALAREAVGRKEWDRAEDLLARLTWYRPGDPEARYLRIGAALARDEPTVAARLLAGVPDSDPGAVGARLAEGRLWLQAFRPREAEAAFRAALRLDRHSDAARLALIAILAIQGRAREYETEAWALHVHGEAPIKALRLLAQAAPAIPPDTLARGADEGTLLRGMFGVDPDDPQTRIALARFERGRGHTDEALRLLEPLRDVASASPEAQLEWAACLLEDGEVERLAPFFQEPPGPVGEFGQYWLLRGEWADRSGRSDEALTCFRTAIRRDPRDPAAHYRLGRALRAAGREDEALAEMEVARTAQELKDLVARISDRSRDAALLAQAGRLCARLGRDREARAWLGLALRADPNRADAREALADLGRSSGGESEADHR